MENWIQLTDTTLYFESVEAYMKYMERELPFHIHVKNDFQNGAFKKMRERFGMERFSLRADLGHYIMHIFTPDSRWDYAGYKFMFASQEDAMMARLIL
jgi:hypothetical protein